MRLIIGIAVIVAAAGVLLWFAVGRGTVYYYSVAELLGKSGGQDVRVAGDLQAGSLKDDGQGGHTFTLLDREQQAVKLMVVYRGALPDAFKDQPGTEVVAEGRLDGQGIFLAQTLITKCPSKYEAAP
jgi:cytochrome c-type biogenesis protein CcmE